MPTMFAQIGVEHSRQYGTTFEQFAKVSVKNHHHSTMNAKSMYRIETPLEEVMGAEMISYPNTKLMCSVNVDGSAAAVLASEAVAKRLGLMDRAVRVLASELSSNPFTARQQAMPDFSAATRAGGKKRLRKMPASDPKISTWSNCTIVFATAELVHYENLGLCGEGEAGPFIDAGENRPRRQGTGQCLGADCSRKATRWAPPGSPISTRSAPICVAKPAKRQVAGARPRPDSCGRRRPRHGQRLRDPYPGENLSRECR